MTTAAGTESHSRRIYFGWWVIAALFVVGMVVYGAGLYSYTLLIPPLTKEFGWGRAATGGLVSVFWLAAPLSLIGGLLNERIGSQRLIVIGIVIEGICLILTGVVSSLDLMYIIRALMGFGKILVVVAVSPLASIWFRRRFGSALAVCYSGWHLGGLTLAPVTGWLIASFGWRPTCFILGALIPTIALPCMLLASRFSSPRQLGLAVDGDALSEGLMTNRTNEQAPASGGSLSEILRSLQFWVVVLATVLGCCAYSGVLAHQASLSADIGLSGELAAIAVGLTAGMAFLGALSFGFLTDTCNFRTVLVLQFGLMAAGVTGFLLLFQFPSIILLFASVITFGFAVGGYEVVIISDLQARFGARSFSYVFGIWYSFFAAALFGAPILIGRSFDTTGSYRLGFTLMLAAVTAAGALFILLPNKVPHSRD